jgi:hypothetical protein
MVKCILVGVLALAMGLLAGRASRNNSYLNGRLSACKDITSVLNAGIPLELDCKVEGGEVYITTPLNNGILMTLDGKPKS